MSKPEQVLTIEPQNELRFRGPFTGAPVTSYMKLTNPTNHKVYFKIKTTAPKRYCVRPNSGVLKPKEVTEIAVCLQPYDFDPTEKSKHKFMVQTLLAPEGDNDDYPQDVWRDSNPSQLMDSKLKCVFENLVSSATTTKGTPTTTTTKSDVNVTNGKNKGTGDTVKAPKPLLAEGDTEEKLMKAAQEVNQLRVQESNLRQENLQLRNSVEDMSQAPISKWKIPKKEIEVQDNEEILRWRNATLDKDANWSDQPSGASSHMSTQLSPTFTSIAIAVAMVIVGYLLGKLI